MSEQLNRIEDMLAQLIKMVGVTNAKVEETNTQLESLRIELGEKIDNLAEGQERHEKLLELLSKRSLEHEMYINDFKRNK